MRITFPSKTAKQIVEACKNKLGSGKLLYNTDWYEKEDFYTTEKCRKGTFEISDEIIGYGKNWNECKDLIEKEGSQMLNFAEYVFFVQEYHKATGKYPEDGEWKYSWTSSRSSHGDLVLVGYCDSGGVLVSRGGEPGGSGSGLGVRFSRSVAIRGAKAIQAEAESGSLESRVRALEDDMNKIKKFLII